MPKIINFLVALLLSLAAGAYAKEPFDSVTYRPKNDSGITLKQTGANWTLSVKDESGTHYLDVKVTPSNEVGAATVKVLQTGKQTKKLPQEFSIQWSNGITYCDICSTNLKSWTRDPRLPPLQLP
jgi:hypothetical protein